MSEGVEADVVRWRRDFHQFPELSNREFKTAKKVEAALREMGIEVQTGIAYTGVVGLLKGGRPGPVVALRADMDGLPVTERVDLPFASKEKTRYNEQDVGVMHACGHDTHVAILLGTAQVLSQLRDRIPGTVKFIFQPAEEGAPRGEGGGARMMVEQGVLENPAVEAIFGLHIASALEVNKISYRPGGLLASSDSFSIKVKGRQTHGTTPWTGADPIVAAAQIITGLQTIVSRSSELTKAAAVVSVGSIHGGVRNNIIPEEVNLIGTIRALDSKMQDKLHERIRLVATKIAESMDTVAEVEINRGYPVTYNDPELTAHMLPTLQRVAGADQVLLVEAITGAEDFSFFQKKIPGLFIFLGGRSPDISEDEAPPHHTPDFFIDESGLGLGVRTLTSLALDYLQSR